VLVDMYRRWLFEVWGAGNFDAARELLAENLVDHNAVPGQPRGRAGDLWAATSVLLGLPSTGRLVVMSGQEIFRAEDGLFVEVWHLEDVGAMLRALELEPPRAILRLAVRRSARRYRRQRV
jgi:hypothetical protein